MHSKIIIKTLKELIKAAIKIDNKIYKKVIKKKYNNSCNNTNIYTENHTSYYQSKIRFFRKKNNSYIETIFIKLNFIQQYKEKNFKIKNNNKQNNHFKICYLYNKLNYFTRNH